MLMGENCTFGKRGNFTPTSNITLVQTQTKPLGQPNLNCTEEKVHNTKYIPDPGSGQTQQQGMLTLIMKG